MTLLAMRTLLSRWRVIHHQFESIHPFYDGNGRTGRIINILYLVKLGLLDSPSSIFLATLIKIRVNIIGCFRRYATTGMGSLGCFYILEGIEQTSRQTTRLIQGMRDLCKIINTRCAKSYPKSIVKIY